MPPVPVATHHKCTIWADDELRALANDPEMSLYDVHDMIVPLAVHGPNRASHHLMLGET